MTFFKISALLLLSSFLYAHSASVPLVVEPIKEISTIQNPDTLPDPNVPKKSISVPLVAQTASFRRGPMTRRADYDPIKNETHIWDMRYGSYTLPGDHTRMGMRKNRRLSQDYERED